MIDESTVLRAVNQLLQAAPGATVIVYGSQARGDAVDDSDLDILVVEPHLQDRHAEMVRLQEVLGPLLLPADIMVVSRETFDKWRNSPSTIFYHAEHEGKAYGNVA